MVLKYVDKKQKAFNLLKKGCKVHVVMRDAELSTGTVQSICHLCYEYKRHDEPDLIEYVVKSSGCSTVMTK